MRTAIDLGVVLGARELATVLVRARQRKLFEPPALRAELARLARPGRDGIRTARDALELMMIGDRPADTVLELAFAFVARDFGLPPYSYQHPVRIRGKRYFIDFAYPEVLLAIEVDGYEERASSTSMEYDLERANLLAIYGGWTVIRFTWARVLGDPAGVAEDVLAALRSLGYRNGR